MVTRLTRTGLTAALLLCAPWALGADFDGSKALVCATVDAHACDPRRGLPARSAGHHRCAAVPARRLR